MSGKTATKRLREMLDERGVAHSDHYLSTIWRDGHGILHLAGEPMADGSLVVDMLTPEQAIAATLGRGECQIETTENWLPAERYHRCKECGAFFAVLDASHDIPPRYCPNCGAKVRNE